MIFKNKMFVLLWIFVLITMVASSYLEQNSLVLKSQADKLNNQLDMFSKIAQTNRWIHDRVAQDIETLPVKSQAEQDLIELIDEMKSLYNTTIGQIETTTQGVIYIPCTIMVYRDEIGKLTNLMKTKIPYGYMKLKKAKVVENHFSLEFNLMIFYKGDL